MILIKSSMLIAVCALSVPSVYALDAPQRQGRGNGQYISAMDTNKDKKISKEEAKGRLARKFDKFDLDGDGFITETELKTAIAQKAAANQGKLIDKLDKDGDKKISKDEAKGKIAQYFIDIDANGDGYLDLKELESMTSKK